MIKINQTRFGDGVGNCFAACVCCILEIEDVESVPNFCYAADDWWTFFKKWLMKNHNLETKFSFVSKEDSIQILNGQFQSDIKPPFILGGPNRDGIMHAVLYCPDGTIWNTNRTCKGIIEVVDIVSIYPPIKHIVYRSSSENSK